jgi:hypothetical protein
MKKMMYVPAIMCAVACIVAPVQAWAEDAPQGSKVVADNEDCPNGMVVGGMIGGEDRTTKICVAPQTSQMSEDTIDVGDPNTTS